MGSSKSASTLSQVVDQAKEQAADLGERMGPALDDVRVRLDEARDRLTPLVEDAREAARDAAERARPHATAAKVAATAATAKGARKVATALDERLADEHTPALVSEVSERKKGGKLKKLFVLAGLGGAAAFVAKKLTSQPAPSWQSVPPPASTPSSGPSTSPAGSSTSSGAATAGSAGAGDVAHDAGGASPGEVASDSVDEPHQPTTPDNPADEVDVTQQ